MEKRIKPTVGRAKGSGLTTLFQEAGRAFVLTFGYFASAVISALVAVFGRVAYAYLVGGAESRAGLSAGEMFAHALRLSFLSTGVVLVLCMPVAWLPLYFSLAILWRVLRNLLVTCLISGVVTASILAAYLFAVLGWILPNDGEGLPFWIVLAHELPFAVAAGAIGGLVLWALCHRELRSREVGADTVSMCDDSMQASASRAAMVSDQVTR